VGMTKSNRSPTIFERNWILTKFEENTGDYIYTN